MDAIYVKKVLDGDVDAFRYFVMHHQQTAFGIALSMVKNESDAKDIVQNSFIQAFESLESFRQEAQFSSWLGRIVINNCLRFLEKRKTVILEPGEFENHQGIEYNEALRSLKKQELQNILKKALRRIPPKEALAVQLFYLEQMSVKEIEETTGFTHSHVKVLLHRGRKCLHAQLNDLFSKTKLEL
jgi:RNA polymerase sigma-70 factor (ECF subfamily)